MLGCKVIDTPMDSKLKLLSDQGKFLENQGSYRKLVRKLNYLTMTRQDIACLVSVVSQFMSTLRTNY